MIAGPQRSQPGIKVSWAITPASSMGAKFSE